MVWRRENIYTYIYYSRQSTAAGETKGEKLYNIHICNGWQRSYDLLIDGTDFVRMAMS